MLANEISKIVLIGSIPVCGEALWTEIFTLTNTVFCVVSLFESVLVTIVSNNTISFRPDWMTALLTSIVPMARNETTKPGSPRMRSGSLGRSRLYAERTTPPTFHTDGSGSSTSEVRRGTTSKIVTLSSHGKYSPLQS